MGVGSKLGSAFGAIGQGLSFVPGPWSALGALFGVAGQTSTMVDQRKQRKEAEKKAEEEKRLAEKKQLESALPTQDAQRPEQAPIPVQDNATVQVPRAKVFNPQGASDGGIEGQMSSEIVNFILGGDNQDMRGP
jgi:hypothetical protein